KRPANAALVDGRSRRPDGPIPMMSDIVSAEWLMQNLSAIRAVDASWYMPADKRDAKAEFEAGHIPGAVFYDLDALSDRATDLPHMLTAPERFARDVGALGIGD